MVILIDFSIRINNGYAAINIIFNMFCVLQQCKTEMKFQVSTDYNCFTNYKYMVIERIICNQVITTTVSIYH